VCQIAYKHIDFDVAAAVADVAAVAAEIPGKK